MKTDRRTFVKQLGVVTASTAAVPHFNIIKSLNDNKIRIATIGMGIQGFADTRAALRTEMCELVAVADLYDGRLAHAKEVFGNQIATTRDYREILERKDVDAVLIVTPDHWHDRISIAALKKGKHVYCEKPMVQHIEEGAAVIATAKATGKVMQIGSQRISGAAFKEAKRLVEAGDIGMINFIESTNDRFNSIGAWQYSIPTDASLKTIDWETFLGHAPKRAFDPVRFFRWRNYRDYGTGVAGDLFIHLITGVHFVTGALGPHRIFSSGQLSYWKDGRDVPDVMIATMEYPAMGKFDPFQMVLRVNFANAGSIKNVTRIVGNEGEITFSGESLTLTKRKLAAAPGYGGGDSFNTFTNAQQQEYQAAYEAKYPIESRTPEPVKEIKFEAPKDDDAHKNHFATFFEGILHNSPIVEDPLFGFRAAAPVLACNKSYFEKKVVNWDPKNLKLT
ncbi:Gfo/Idh/MocA family protein [Runella slithyformis]|uniref:Oxidoreductase domain protein n=1 Tax=Runella slithyformis (strain ATCC 29530 / DSM 19594 / LMG 11500 / NCIMB 11436 / LSU 4) TaxID=761193 RepID=A0A7U3ZP75_RUNSL|nr:Gfo/Idh/MocA family oxidoreductase [Runella slithyformis]AEI50826.1 oxidoreductase domain protein [Runella slithyformis DSM 19594]